MKVLCVSVAVLVMAWLVHIVVWGIRVPKRQILSLLVILIGSGVGVLCCVARSADYLGLAAFTAWELARCLLVLFTMVLCYCVGYSALSERSPTLTVVTFVSRCNGQAASVADIEGLLVDARLVGRRLDGMVEAGLLQLDGVRYSLTARGQLW